MSISCKVNLSKVPNDNSSYTLKATTQECINVAERLLVPQVYSVEIEMRLSHINPTWQLEGTIFSKMQQVCSRTGSPFDAETKADFWIILSDSELPDEEKDVEVLTNSEADLSDLALQYLALETPTSPIAPEALERTSDNSLLGHHKDSWHSKLSKLKKTTSSIT